MFGEGQQQVEFAAREQHQRVVARAQFAPGDVQVSRLRHKLEEDPKNPVLIRTVRNGGYIFAPDVSRG